MSVVGIVILITLLLILKLITQVPATPHTVISLQELQENIKSLRTAHAEIKDEITKLNHAKINSEITVPTKEQINALNTENKRLENNIAELENELEKSKQQTENLNNSPKLKIFAENKKQIEQLKEQLALLNQQQNKLSANEQKLQEKVDKLRADNTKLDNTIAATITQKLKVKVQKTSNKTAFICVYGENGLTIIPTDGSPQKHFTSRSEFYQWVDSRNKEMEYFIIYFRPSRFKRYDEMIKQLKSKGFDVGFQVIGEKTSLTVSD
jgi:hypothetical protein